MTDTLPVTAADIDAAADRLAGAVIRSPLVPAAALTEMLGVTLSLKLETLQRTASFKERGAVNKLKLLDGPTRNTGVIAMSAGNHAQGVAYHARRLGIPATIVMPVFTPFTKVAQTEAFGARVVLSGESLSEASDEAHRIAAAEGLAFVHPYDDPAIIAGQGTVGLEMLADDPDLDTILVPVGGGGLIAGVAVAAKARRPDIRVIGVEVHGYASMSDRRVGLAGAYAGVTLAEGIAVKVPGDLTGAICDVLVDDIVVVDEGLIEDAVERLATQQKLIVEGAGAAGLAAVLADPGRFAGSRVGLVACGGNIDPRILSSILMRGLARGGRLARLRVRIVDAPGQLSLLADTIGKQGGNIVEVHHRRLLFDLPVKSAFVDLIVETRDGTHIHRIAGRLNDLGHHTTVLSGPEG